MSPARDMGHRLALLALAASSLHCGAEVADARPQWLLTIATDAQVPQFGDRLLVELSDDEGPVTRRQLGVGNAAAWPVSFGIAAPLSERNLAVRARLYRSVDAGPDGLPASRMLIDAAGHFGPPAGVDPVGLVLSMDCFGIVGDLDVTCDPDTGALVDWPVLDAGELPVVASWGPGRRVPCPEAPPAGASCIEGGSFLLGFVDALTIEPRVDPTPERLVQLSPFALDQDEISVGLVRGLIQGGQLDPIPVLWDPDPSSRNNLCHYLGPDDPSRDALPINCVTAALAEEVCHLLDMELPTEAQWEYAAGNLDQETPYPWGADRDVCELALVSRGRGAALDEDTSCIDGPPGPAIGGRPGDVTAAGVRNLAGNVSEYVSDHVGLYDDDCWSPQAQLLVDPRCELPGGNRMSRGGSYARQPLIAHIYYRSPYVSPTPVPRPEVGFRCARRW